eukprot:m.474106 g.474106  ORF g.474106 m.474106 type:complete len:848 (+) comp21671_c0_seq1:114-2657(+)
MHSASNSSHPGAHEDVSSSLDPKGSPYVTGRRRGGRYRQSKASTDYEDADCHRAGGSVDKMPSSVSRLGGQQPSQPVVRSMDALIPVINKLQDVFSAVGFDKAIELPQIVVVGAQSSGKSSVLESIVGRDFLPRGTGIVTRVPLIMQLTNVPPLRAREAASATSSPSRASVPTAGTPTYPRNVEEWATFLHNPQRTYTDFDEVRAEIDAQTVRIVGDQKNVADKPIHLRIFSPHVLNLTMVDLPGITKVAIADQPADIERQIRRLILKYINNTNAIILAVSPANADIANSDSLKLAMEVDPQGKRTIGVCTKLDLMDKGTDATNVLTGKVVPLKLGMIGVVNRSQYDIDHRKSIGDARAEEDDFFATHYSSLKHRCGVNYLAATLNKLLMHHIRDCLPELKSRIDEMQQDTAKQLAALGDPVVERMDKGGMLLQILTNFSSMFSDSIEGRSQIATNSPTLLGGAMICHIFHNTFAHTLQNIGPLDGLPIKDIQAAIRNTTGTRPSLFVPEMSFEMLVKKQMKRLLAPGLRCVELVYQELERLVHKCLTPELSRFKVLRERVLDVTTHLLKQRLPQTNAMVENLIAIELAYINTNHNQFESGSGAMVKMLTRMSEQMSHTVGDAARVVTRDTRASAPAARTLDQIVEATPQQPRKARSMDRTGIPDMQFVNAAALSMDTNAAEPATPGAPTDGGGGGGIYGFLSSFTRRPENQARMPPPPDTPAILSTPTADEFHSTATPSGITASDLSDLSSKEQMEIEIVRSLIESYYAIVRDKVLDSIPKTIMHFLVNHVQAQLQTELVKELWRREQFDELLEEDPQIAQERRRTREMLEALNHALTIVTEVGVL